MQWYDASLLLTYWDTHNPVPGYEFQNGKVRQCWNQKLGEVSVVCYSLPSSDDIPNRVCQTAKALCKLNHPNLLQVHGVTVWPNCLGIVVDEACNCSMVDILHKKLSLELKLQFAHDLASALTYLHWCTEGGIVHGNVALKSLFLNGDLQIQLPCLHILEKLIIVRHDQEDEEILTKESDIFDFGQVLAQLLTQKSFSDSRELTIELVEMKQELKTSKCSSDLNILKCLEKVMWQCLAVDTSARPAMTKVCRWLSDKLSGRNRATLFEEKASLLHLQHGKFSVDKSKFIPLKNFSYPFEEPGSLPILSLLQAEAYNRKKQHESIVFMGGHYTKNEVIEYDPFTDTLHKLPDLNYGRWSCASAFHDNCIYVFGGTAKGGKSCKYVECLNLIEKGGKWQSKCEMLMARHGTVAVVISELIYLPAGFIDLNSEEQGLTSAIQCYDPNIDRWEQVGDLLIPRGHHAAVAIKHNLYNVGGVTHDDERVDALECFDTINKQSTFLQPMSIKRGALGAAVLDGLIYAFGGQEYTSVDLDTAECYNPITNEWHVLENKMNKLTKACGATTASGKIYVVGGVGKNSAGKAMEVYDPKTEKWKLFRHKLKLDWINPGITTITRATEFLALF